jgi:raffinose/stachyose/melibiose transport system permease protein
MGELKRTYFIQRSLKNLVLILAAFVTLIPIWLILIGSVKPEDEIYTNIFGLPKKLVFENFIDAWLYGNFQIYYKNSVIISLFSTILVLVLSACAGFVLSRKDLLLRKIITALFLIGITIPIQVPVMPLFVEIKKFGLYNKLQGIIVILVGFRLAFTTVIFSRFMRQVPAEIEEAALIDGCSVWQDFTKIVLPLSTNVICVGGILNAVYSWNNFFFPMVFVSTNSFKPLPSGLMAFKGENTIMFTKLFAAITIVTIPIIIVYLLLQKYFVQGITAGAVKG